AAGLEEEMNVLLTNRFHFSMVDFQKNALMAAGPQWFAAIGAFLRGLEERGKDNEISLSSSTSSESFYHEQLLGFIAIWRNIILTVGLFFLVVFWSANAFLDGYLEKKENSLLSFNAQPSIEELKFLVGQAKEFNQLIGKIEKSSVASPSFQEILLVLETTAVKNSVVLENIDIISPEAPVKISGKAPNNIAAIQFKNDLVATPRFKDVDLPFTAINSLSDNSVGFALSFKYE
ncbi:MAG: hypothetical protein Q8O49_00315, partial [bacterium]|nr:hypothetical protein [bacterium]